MSPEYRALRDALAVVEPIVGALDALEDKQLRAPDVTPDSAYRAALRRNAYDAVLHRMKARMAELERKNTP